MSEESKKLVADTTTRLDKAADELQTLVVSPFDELLGIRHDLRGFT